MTEDHHFDLSKRVTITCHHALGRKGLQIPREAETVTVNER